MNAKLSVILVGAVCAAFLLTPATNAQLYTVDDLVVTRSATGILPTKGAGYVIVEQNPTFTDVTRGYKLLEAYNKAKTMSPGPANRLTVLIPPGNYNMELGHVTLDTEYIDLIGMIPARMTKRIKTNMVVNGLANYTAPMEVAIALDPPDCGVRIYGNGTCVMDHGANHSRIANMIIETTSTTAVKMGNSSDHAAYIRSGNGSDIIVEHVAFKGCTTFAGGVPWSMRVGCPYRGVFRDCVANMAAFGANPTMSSGLPAWALATYEDCVAGFQSFGYEGEASGNFSFCTAGGSSFGANGKATGTFRNCYAGSGSFGCNSWTVPVSGFFENCYGGDLSFGGRATSITGTFRHCVSSGSGFGTDSKIAAGAVLEYCTSGSYSFGASSAFSGEISAGAVLSHCKAGSGSFAHAGVLSPDAILQHCSAGDESFGDFNCSSADFNQSKSFYAPQGDLSMGTFGPPSEEE